jgi:hypothetical protein
MAGMIDLKQERVAQELARLASLDRAGCIELWREWFGSVPPRYLSAVFMRKALAHEAQCQMLGRLRAADVRVLRSVAAGRSSGLLVASTLSAGTHLVREWNGRTYQVEAMQSGYVMDGKTYRSLTAIARRITGTNWSGPRFFGLVNRCGKHQEEDRGETAINRTPDAALALGLTDPKDSRLSASASSVSVASTSCEVEVPGHV